jgi:hypothetical protein
MPPRVYDIAFTVPPGTPANAPVSVPWVTEDNTIVDIELEVPPGHNGLTGIRVVKGSVQLIPWSAGTFIIANDYSRTFPVGAYIPTSDLTLQGYNTGAYPHTFYLRMTVVNYDPGQSQNQGSPSQALVTGIITSAPDPLSPDATAAETAPIDTTDLTVPPVPAPTGL